MFHFLNKHIVLQIIIAILLFCWSVFTIFTNMTLVLPDGQGILYDTIYNHFVNNPVGMRVMAVVMLLFVILFLQLFYNRNKFSDIKTIMPIVFFLLLINAGKFLYSFAPASFTIPILTLIMLINTKDANEQPTKNRTFASGILVGLCSLIDPHSVLILLFLIISLLANRFSKFKEIVIAISGFLFVYIYYFATAYLFNKIPLAVSYIQKYQFFGIIRNFSSMKIMDWILGGYLLLSVLYATMALKLYFDNKLIVLRKRYLTIIILFFVMFVLMLFADSSFRYAILYVTIPVSLIFSLLTVLKNGKLMKDFIMIALFVLLWL